MVFALLYPWDEEGRLILPMNETVFVRRANGAIDVPYEWKSMLKELQVGDMDDLLRLTVTAIERDNEAQ
jgi:hypothetical protein